MLLHRVITALVIAVILLTLLFYTDEVLFKYFFIGVLLLASWEWANLSGLKLLVLRVVYVLLNVTCLLFLLRWLGYLPELVFLYWPDIHFSLIDVFNFSGVVWAFILLWLLSYPASSIFWKSVSARLLLGVFVMLPFFVALIALRYMPQGIAIIIYLLALIAAADIGAYFVGKRFGRKKLMERVSPGKTWEGFYGGLVLAFLFALAVFFLRFNFSLTLLEFLIIAVVTSIVSVIGDLFESMLKRYRGIKDSSNLLPGHGGILDRIDSHLAAVPIFYLLFLLLRALP